MFSLRRPIHHVSGDPARVDYLREIQDDVVITSPKVYESGLITRLDLRLVDLYGDDTMENRDMVRDTSPHLPGSLP